MADLLLLIGVFAGVSGVGGKQALYRGELRVGTNGAVESSCRVVYQKENVARYTGQGRGLTAPSRAASYHGPMPTLSTCPSSNKDGRGLQEHPRGYPRGIAEEHA